MNMKTGSIVLADGPEGYGAYVITDQPEHDRTVIRIAKSATSERGRWIRTKDVVDVVVY
jgi:hypothetical protein